MGLVSSRVSLPHNIQGISVVAIFDSISCIRDNRYMQNPNSTLGKRLQCQKIDEELTEVRSHMPPTKGIAPHSNLHE